MKFQDAAFRRFHVDPFCRRGLRGHAATASEPGLPLSESLASAASRRFAVSEPRNWVFIGIVRVACQCRIAPVRLAAKVLSGRKDLLNRIASTGTGLEWRARIDAKFVKPDKGLELSIAHFEVSGFAKHSTSAALPFCRGVDHFLQRHCRWAACVSLPVQQRSSKSVAER